MLSVCFLASQLKLPLDSMDQKVLVQFILDILDIDFRIIWVVLYQGLFLPTDYKVPKVIISDVHV